MRRVETPPTGSLPGRENPWPGRGAAALKFVQGACLAVSLYQAAITIAGRFARRSLQEREMPERLPHFVLLVCARNEELVIERIVGDFLSCDYPRDAFDVLVVAHNCTDATAAKAHAAGARVFEFSGESGKAVAMRAGVMAAGQDWDFIGVFDADTRVPPDLLREVARHSEDEDCIQVETIPMTGSDWIGEGYGLGRRARNALWWQPREALGLGTTTSGSGYFVRPDVAREFLTTARTITEDLELTVHIAASGRRVAYVSSTFVGVEEPLRLTSSMRQRVRWARGHMHVLAFEWPRLVRQALRGDWRAADMAIYLAVPTRLLTRTGVSVSLVLSVFRAPFALPFLPVFVAALGEWLLPLIVGLQERLLTPSPSGLRLAIRHGVLSLLWFPIGIWALATAGARTWHPSPRHRHRGPDDAAPHTPRGLFHRPPSTNAARSTLP